MITKQISFDEHKKLYLVATPIGNLEDISLRALNILKSCDLILCEDTRVSAKLLSYYQIQKPLLSFYDFNSELRLKQMDDLFHVHNHIVLISDAGTPLINDPGYDLVNYCLLKDINVIAIPGATSLISALCCSGLTTNSFIFGGFFPREKSKALSFFNSIKKFAGTIIFFDSPHRLKNSLEIIYQILGDVRIVLARELTKLYETIYRGDLLSALNYDFSEKGEYVMLLSHPVVASTQDPKTFYLELIKSGVTSKEALQIVAKELSISKNELYKLIKC